MKKCASLFVVLLCVSALVYSQESNDGFIQTAKDFLTSVAEYYGTIEDFRAELVIESGGTESQGVIFFKIPNKMRINFTRPYGQVINNNGEEFYTYLPTQNVVLHQKKRAITSSGDESSFTTKTGLSLLTKNYLVSYLDKPNFVSYKANSRIRVKILKLTWASTNQSFRELVMYIGSDNLIYRVDGVTYNRDNVSFIFSNYEINKGIPNKRFEYDPPPTAHVMDKFLFDEEKRDNE